MNSENLLLRTKDVAEMLLVTPRQVRNLSREHGLPSIKIGSNRRYCVEDVVLWVENQKNKESK